MVYFTCNACGDSVKKPAVEKHYMTKCRGRPKTLTCIDCLKDFNGEEFVAHTKCITEAERYSGKDYVHKESKNSNAKKQETWTDIVHSILESSDYKLSSMARNAFERLQGHENVPRKKAKFQNFVSNCIRMPKAQAEEVWNVLEQELEKMKQVRQQEAIAAKAAKEAAKKERETKTDNNEKENEEAPPAAKKSKVVKAVAEDLKVEVTKKAKKKNKKQKKLENGNDEAVAINGFAAKEETFTNGTNGVNGGAKEVEAEGEQQAAFNWEAVLEKIARKKPDEAGMDKIKRKTVKKYAAHLGVEALSAEQLKKFEKKFTKKCKKVLLTS